MAKVDLESLFICSWTGAPDLSTRRFEAEKYLKLIRETLMYGIMLYPYGISIDSKG